MAQPLMWAIVFSLSLPSLGGQNPQQASTTVTLRYTPPPTEGWAYEVQMTGDQTQTFMGFGEGVPSTFKMEQKLWLHLMPHSTAPDTLVFRMRFDSLRLHMSSEELGRSLIDTTLIPGTEKLVALSHSGRLYRTPQTQSDDSPTRLLSGSISLFESFLGWVIPFPTEPMAIGEQWSNEHQDTVQHKSNLTVSSRRATYILEALVDTLGHRCARIRMTADVAVKFTGQSDIGALAYETTGRSQGISYVELATGFPLVLTEDIAMEGTMAIRGQIELMGTLEQNMRTLVQRR